MPYFEKLTFIEDIYAGEQVNYDIEKRGKTAQTGYNWVKSWNEYGFEGLKRKPGSGAPSKLTEEQLKELKQIKQDLERLELLEKAIEIIKKPKNKDGLYNAFYDGVGVNEQEEEILIKVIGNCEDEE